MKKIINRPQDFVKECVQAIEMAYGSRLRVVGTDRRLILRKVPKELGKVAVVTAGGSGHLPVFLGYVGEGMLDGCAVGNVFASPSSQNMEQMIREVDRGAGVLCLYGNYGGDKINFHMAQEMTEFDGIKIKKVLVCDDAASAPADERSRRRGVAGMVYAFKIAGAAAELGWDLSRVYEVTERALENIRTMGVALSPCIVPEVGKSTFSIEGGEMEVGMGIHGEPGIEVCPMMTADEIGNMITEKLLKEISLSHGDEVSVMANECGYLSELDARNGDGDLGLTMKNGFQAAADAMEQEKTKDLGQLFFAGSKAFNLAAPSTMGTILSFCMMGMARKLKGKTEASIPELADGMENGLNLVMEKAGSAPGEKTILDAVMPAVKTLKEGIQQEKIWQLAAEAAEEGMQSTGSMRPVHGRAAYYGDKSIGMVDGGAVAGMLIFRTIAEWKGKETVDAG